MPRLHSSHIFLLATLFGLAPAANANDITLYTPTFALMDPNTSNSMMPMEHADIWERIRAGFGIPDLESPIVTSQTEFYGGKPEYFERTTTRASPYLYHLVEELEKRGMPTELALLPFIESAFNPQAISSARAAGMWQFIPSTGRDYNLKQNLFKDERRDVLASTDAALTYLQKLYGMFGDWQLALAAYNWGEGSVQRAIDRNIAAGRPTDFNSLSAQMPVETRNYVPKLQAVKNIIADPGNYGVSLPAIDNQPYFVTVGRIQDIDVKVAAQLAELSVDEFKALNPQFNRPVIIGGEDTKILLPESNAEKFRQNLSSWTHKLSSWTAHTVSAAKERIDTIATRFGTTPAILREVNHIPPRMQLRVGSTILVPKTDDEQNDITAEIADNATMGVVPERSPTRQMYVNVGRGDTLATIARRYGVSVGEIRQWNNIQGEKVHRGERIALTVANKGGKSHTGKSTRTRIAKAGHGASARSTKASTRTATATTGKRAQTARKKGGLVLASAKGN